MNTLASRLMHSRRLHTALSCWVMLALLAGGCASVRRARDAQAPGHIPPGERTATAAELHLNAATVLTLDRALQLALANHPSIMQARLDVLAADARWREARAAYWPALDAGGGYRKATSNTESAPHADRFADGYDASLSLDVLLYDFGKTPALVRQALGREMAAVEALRAARSDLTLAVRAAYLDVCRAQELLKVKEEAERQFGLRLEQVRAFVEFGRRTRYDVTKAEVDLGNARLELIDARNTLATARATLNRRLGLAEDPGYTVTASDLAPPGTDLAPLMATARQQHPGIRALQLAENVASAAVDEAIADLYPSLHLQGQYGLSGRALPLVGNLSAALRSSVGIFSGWSKVARIDEAAANLRSARAAVADREQQVYLDLSLALNQLVTARQRLDLTDLVLRQARETTELVAEQYRLGKASAVELTDAQVTLFNAQADQVKARFDCQNAIAQIRHATGEEYP